METLAMMAVLLIGVGLMGLFAKWCDRVINLGDNRTSTHIKNP